MEADSQRIDHELLKRDMFFNLETSYFIEATQEQGERWLGEIAKEAREEYAWIFDTGGSQWHHLIADKQSSIDPEVGTYDHSLILPKAFESAFKPDMVHYHIHPGGYFEQPDSELNDKYEYENLIVRSQMPSLEDVQAVVYLTQSGYAGFKIVTGLGVTTLAYDRTRENEVPALKFTLTSEEIMEGIKDGGVYGGIQHWIHLWNDRSRGIFTVSFTPFEESKSQAE